MNDSASGKVKGAKSAYPSSHSPYPVRHRVIDKSRPQNRENHQCAEFHPVCKCACYQCRCDYGKHGLEYHEYGSRYRCSVIRVGRCADTIQADPFKSPYQSMSVVRPECKAVPKKHPLEAYNCENNKAVHYNSKDIFFPNNPAIKSPRAGVMSITRAAETSTQAVSPELI